ncbi:hypothetical protein SETIT_9G074000v2 [Setaria italica]|uniref:Uncharacterized protein n=1 Tax=Setaria italica TaxID=4555 RepID=A0A368SE76_SETIT|nr:hypothetical protein SETIT_9G074000v2 [Setaria italica]
MPASPQKDPRNLGGPWARIFLRPHRAVNGVWRRALFRFYAGVHPGRLGTAMGGGPTWLAVRVWLAGGGDGISGSDSRLPPNKNRGSDWTDRRRGRAWAWLAGWLARVCACAGAVVRQWRASRAEPRAVPVQAQHVLLPPVPGARRLPRPRPRGSRRGRSFLSRHLGRFREFALPALDLAPEACKRPGGAYLPET